MLQCIDKLHQELEVRMKSTKSVHLINYSDEQLSVLVSNFCKTYEMFVKEKPMAEIKNSVTSY